MTFKNSKNYRDIDILVNLIKALRGENGCPWDRKQTPSSIGTYVLEEVYELLEAIEGGDTDEVCEELGDVLFLLLFLVDIFQTRGSDHVPQRDADRRLRR